MATSWGGDRTRILLALSYRLGGDVSDRIQDVNLEKSYQVRGYWVRVYMRNGARLRFRIDDWDLQKPTKEIPVPESVISKLILYSDPTIKSALRLDID